MIESASMSTTSFRWKAVLVILVAILVRVVFVVGVDRGIIKFELNPDTRDYLSLAHNLATGVGYARSVDDTQPFSRPVQFSAYRPPLYPAFLAIAFQFSGGTLFLRMLQIGLQALSLYFLLQLGLILLGEWPALIAGVLFALYPPLIQYSADLGTESLFLLLLIAALLVFYGANKERSDARCFCLGLLVGLTALCRPAGLMLAPALALSIWFTTQDWKHVARKVVVLGMAVAMVILPWGYRNYRLFHKVVLFTTNGGLALWGGAYMRLVSGATLAVYGEENHRALGDTSETDRDRTHYREAFAILDHSPRLWGEMFTANFSAMYTLVPSSLYHSRFTRVIYSISYIPLLISGLIGVWLSRRRWKELSLLWAWIVISTTFYCFFYGQIRYRVPTVDPILMLGAGVCFAPLLGRLVGSVSIR